VSTDIEGSTVMAGADPEGFRVALQQHNEILRAAIAANAGLEIRTEGDSFFAVFQSAPDAVRFSVGAQRALEEHSWADGMEVRVRMGVHTGAGVRADHDDDDYVGIHVHRAARIEAAGRYEGLGRESLETLEGREAEIFAEGRAMPTHEAIANALRQIDIEAPGE
jgi:class 3 adenylate cyclase